MYYDTLEKLSLMIARKYQRLSVDAQIIADAGITRHFNACRKCGCGVDAGALREIIEDAALNRAVYAENDADKRVPESHFQSNLLAGARLQRTFTRMNRGF